MALVGVGCGDGGDPPPPGTPSAAEYLVKPADVDQPAGGLAAAEPPALVESIQYNDFDGYLESLAAPLQSAGAEPDGAAAADLALASGELVRSQPKIDAPTVKDGAATIYTRIETRQPVGATSFTTSSSRQAFTLVREGGEWKIADDFYVTTAPPTSVRSERRPAVSAAAAEASRRRLS